MDKMIFGLIGGAVSALALGSPAQAAPAAPAVAQTLAAGSFEELLQPLPNPLHVLRAVDEANSGTRALPSGGEMIPTQFGHHHHHHHHQFFSHHHHHHHHHHNFLFGFGYRRPHCFVQRHFVYGPFGRHVVVRRICR